MVQRIAERQSFVSPRTKNTNWLKGVYYKEAKKFRPSRIQKCGEEEISTANAVRGTLQTIWAPVAQLDRAPVFGTGCRGFESLLAHHLFFLISRGKKPVSKKLSPNRTHSFEGCPRQSSTIKKFLGWRKSNFFTQFK